MIESLFSKITREISVFYNSVENSIRCISMFRKIAVLAILRKFLLTRVVGL